MEYEKDEIIEVLSPTGNWLKGKYLFSIKDLIYPHVVECFELSYFPGIKVPDNKIRKVMK